MKDLQTLINIIDKTIGSLRLVSSHVAQLDIPFGNKSYAWNSLQLAISSLESSSRELYSAFPLQSSMADIRSKCALDPQVLNDSSSDMEHVSDLFVDFGDEDPDPAADPFYFSTDHLF